MIKELEGRALDHQLNDGRGSFALFLFTPFCGTCKLAEELLFSAMERFKEETPHADLPIYKVNVNYAPQLVQAYKVSSVPCLMIWKKGTCIVQQYVLGSRTKWDAWLKLIHEEM